MFIVRIWREPREIGDAAPERRGVIEYVATGEKLYFRGHHEVISFIVEKTGMESLRPRPTAGQGERGGLLRRLLAHLGLTE